MAVADLGEVPEGAGPKGQKKFFGRQPPPLSQGLDDRAPPYLKVWIRHCMGHFGWTDAFDKFGQHFDTE